MIEISIIISLLGMYFAIDGAVSIAIQYNSKEETKNYQLVRIIRSALGLLQAILVFYIEIRGLILVFGIYFILDGAVSISKQYDSKEETWIYQLGRVFRICGGLIQVLLVFYL